VDLLTMLLVHAPQLSVDEIRREAIFFLLASSSTTTHATPHIMLELLDWIAGHPEDEGLLLDLTFVKQAVNEGLRLHPPVPALLKRALKDTTLSTGRVLTQGEYLAVDLDAVNSDPATFGDDPRTFDPRRPSVLSAQPYGFSFGAGPHMCLGRPLATSTNKASPEDGTVGALVRLVVGLMGAGLRLDPAAARPTMRQDTVARRFASFPVVFTRL
jgi:cytochrome P450